MFGLFSSRDQREQEKRVRATLEEGRRQGLQHLNQFKQQARHHTQRASEYLGDGSRRARELTSDSAKRIDDSARENPWAYVAAGTLAGIAIGYLLGRK
ncbi:DUF883 family protein [Carnimonas bestiolae]|uniref:DUF883 family protein n=1 Tax=Carnimonas bestiolae TaxID=3402172 RepID=UPI003EDB9B70